VRAALPGQDVDDVSDVGAEVGEGVRRRTELLEAIDHVGRKRAGHRDAIDTATRVTDAQLIEEAIGEDVRVVRGERERVRVRAADRPGRDRAAAIGERCHGN
jgi:hypothetical protein